MPASDKLRGLPVAYVQRHRQELEQQLLEKLMTEPEVKNYQLLPEVKITPGADLGVNIMNRMIIKSGLRAMATSAAIRKTFPARPILVK